MTPRPCTALLTAFVLALLLPPQPAMAAQDWVLDEGSARNPYCMVVPKEPIPSGHSGAGQADAITLYLGFRADPGKAAFAGLKTQAGEGFAGGAEYEVTIIASVRTGEILFKGSFTNPSEQPASDIWVIEEASSETSVAAAFVKAAFGDTPRAVYVAARTGVPALGPFPIETDAIRKTFPSFLTCVEKL